MNDCPCCQALQNKELIAYEDDKIAVVIPAKTLSKGHLRVIPKEHKTDLQEFDDKDVEHMFYAASFSATALFENMQAQGTNIIANTGSELNRKTHFHIDVIARWVDDKLNFLWTPKRLDESELKEVQGKIKDKTSMIGVQKKKKEAVDLDKKPESLEGSGKNAPAPEETKSTEEKQSQEIDKPTPKEESGKNSESKEPEKTEEENYMVKQLRRIP